MGTRTIALSLPLSRTCSCATLTGEERVASRLILRRFRLASCGRSLQSENTPLLYCTRHACILFREARNGRGLQYAKCAVFLKVLNCHRNSSCSLSACTLRAMSELVQGRNFCNPYLSRSTFLSLVPRRKCAMQAPFPFQAEDRSPVQAIL